MQSESTRFIVFEGNIGVGKTSLAKKYAAEFNLGLILEEFEENEFLKLFYQNPERHGLSMELWFMAERYKQLEHHFSKGDLFRSGLVSDYIFTKTLLFAKNTLNENEFKLLTQLFDLLNQKLPVPDLIVYLHRPTHVLLNQIRKRGRAFEQNLEEEYLNNIALQYEQFINSSQNINLLYLHCGEKDFLAEEKYYTKIKDLIRDNRGKGLKIEQL